jgi:hypothetical protein
MEEEINNYRKEIENFQSQKVQVTSIDKEQVSIVRDNDYEVYRLSIHRQDHSGLDEFFKYLYSSMDASSDSDQWNISFSKPLDQVKF